MSLVLRALLGRERPRIRPFLDEDLRIAGIDGDRTARVYFMLTSRAWSDMPCSQVLQPEFMP